MDGIGKQFIEQTKYRKMGKPAQGRGMRQPPLELEWDRTRKLIPLPAPKAIRLGGLSLREVIGGVFV